MKLRNIAALLLLASTTALAQVADPVLMRVNDKEVKRSEFEYAFNKNNTNLAGEGQSVEEYLPMYVDFKLKVAEAESLSLDTLTSFKEEFGRDRNLMAENYLVDTCFINDEAYRVYAKDSATIGKDGFVEVVHIVFLAKQQAPEADVKLAKARIDSAYAMLNEGKTFEDVAAVFEIPAQAIRPFEIVRGQVYPEFEQVAYWNELCEIMEWSKTHVTSTFHICWGAQAGLYYHYGINKQALLQVMLALVMTKT